MQLNSNSTTQLALKTIIIQISIHLELGQAFITIRFDSIRFIHSLAHWLIIHHLSAFA